MQVPKKDYGVGALTDGQVAVMFHISGADFSL